jgi:hypothetical protein
VSDDPQETTMSYSDWAVAFLDIIGFTNKVKRTEADRSGIADISNALWKARQWLDHFKGDSKDVQIQTFSDTTLICASGPTPYELASLTWGIALYQCSMVLNGNLLRGGLAAGPNFQSGTIMFGPAIIDAYEAEQVADWPRVAVASSVLERVNPLASDTRNRPCILTDDRGLAYVDYLMYGCLHLTCNQWKHEYSKKIADPEAIMEVVVGRHRRLILSLRDEAKADPKQLSRCHSLALYHNATIARLNEVLARWQQNDSHAHPSMTTSVMVIPHGMGELSTGADQAVTDFYRAKLKEAPALQHALKGLIIDLCSTFPTLDGTPDHATPHS